MTAVTDIDGKVLVLEPAVEDALQEHRKCVCRTWPPPGTEWRIEDSAGFSVRAAPDTLIALTQSVLMMLVRKKYPLAHVVATPWHGGNRLMWEANTGGDESRPLVRSDMAPKHFTELQAWYGAYDVVTHGPF